MYKAGYNQLNWSNYCSFQVLGQKPHFIVWNKILYNKQVTKGAKPFAIMHCKSCKPHSYNVHIHVTLKYKLTVHIKPAFSQLIKKLANILKYQILCHEQMTLWALLIPQKSTIPRRLITGSHKLTDVTHLFILRTSINNVQAHMHYQHYIQKSNIAY